MVVPQLYPPPQSATLQSSGSPPTPGSTPRVYTPGANRAVSGGTDHAEGEGHGSKATLSRELSDFLVELSIAMQKHAIYPSGHPLLTNTLDGVMRKIALLLADRDSLSIGIARRQLIIEGVGTDPNHPLLKELAARLHKHNLGAVKFGADLTREELGDALSTIAVDAGRGVEPLGDKAAELSERWASVRLFPLNYERLELLYEGKDTEGEDRIRRGGSAKPAQLWVGMARAAMMLDNDAALDGDSVNPLVVAEAIDKNRQHDQAYDQVIVGYLLQIADELKKQGGTPEALELQKRISELVRQLSPATLKKLLNMGGDVAQQRQFLLNASQGMTVEAVLDLVKASTTDGRQTISHSMMRLFTKLSRYAEQETDPVRRANAEASVREHMQKLISEWDLDDPNPTAYGKVLQTMAVRGKRSDVAAAYIECEPDRILQMGFEISTGGPRFENAVTAMLNSARLEPLLNLLDQAPDKAFAESVWSYVDSHDIMWAALTEARIDFPVLERLVKRKRLSAVEPILDVFERAKDARIRERLLDVLVTLGDPVGQYVVRRIEGSRSDQRRELFLMLGKLTTMPEGFDVSRFLLHTDASVRREAIRLLLKFVETREQAIVAAVTDTDERAVFYGLQAAQDGGCPQRAVEIVHQRISAGDLDSSLMTLAIRVLAAADSGAGPQLTGRGRTSVMMKSADVQAAAAASGKKTMDWLVNKVVHRSRFLRKLELESKSPEMLAALSALAAYWNHLPEVQDILNLAIKSNDPELKKAMGAQRVTGRFKAFTDQV
jgi:hypothetical protein